MAINLERDGQEEGMRGLSNLWQASTWHTDFKAVCLRPAQSRVWMVIHSTRKKETDTQSDVDCLQLLPSFSLPPDPPTYL